MLDKNNVKSQNFEDFLHLFSPCCKQWIFFLVVFKIKSNYLNFNSLHKFIVTFRNIFFQFKICEKYMYFDYMGPCTVNILGSSWQNIDVTILWCFLISVRHYAKLFKNALQCSLASVCEEFGMQTSNNASKKASLSSELHSSHCLFVFVSGVLILVSFGAEKRTLNIFELMLNYIIHALFYKAKKNPSFFFHYWFTDHVKQILSICTNTLQIHCKYSPKRFVLHWLCFFTGDSGGLKSLRGFFTILDRVKAPTRASPLFRLLLVDGVDLTFADFDAFSCWATVSSFLIHDLDALSFAIPVLSIPILQKEKILIWEKSRKIKNKFKMADAYRYYNSQLFLYFNRTPVLIKWFHYIFVILTFEQKLPPTICIYICIQ